MIMMIMNKKYIKCNIDTEIHINTGYKNKIYKQIMIQYAQNWKNNLVMMFVIIQNGILKSIINDYYSLKISEEQDPLKLI